MRKKTLNWLGILLASCAGIYFFSYARHALSGKHLTELVNVHVLLALLVLILLYSLLIPTTVLAWTWLLRAMHQTTSYPRLLAIMATTQFGKYLPGNIAQHIGRVALTRNSGIPLSVTLFSIAYEFLLILVACSHLSALTMLWEPPLALIKWDISKYRLPLVILITSGAVLALALAPRAASWLAKVRAARRGEETHVTPCFKLNVRTVMACYVTYLVNFFIVGVGLWLVTHALLGTSAHTPSVIFLTGAFAGSWILGFVAPGAPAGLGIREVLLSAWLSGSLPATQIVLVVVALRIATTVGDALNFGIGSGLIARFHLRASR
ncbi:hypothetical protein [Oleiagrimonas sp.]|jgi:hypothetical protein|uniref:hypothetical protein n=1 Tax=Oleiagrimonas sp. TaxID=2010330 RepID=UPI0026397998|nr:hypothetical protein [Oleiagrimonas sp.]MDA3913411.1 hypothetical protein [Oleiagrimonas sp.]